jgi:hypothetical protein
MLWSLAALGCLVAAPVVLALRFSNPYILPLRSAGTAILVVLAVWLAAIAVLAFREGRRAPCYLAAVLAPIVLSGITVWFFGFVALAVAVMLVTLACLCLLRAPSAQPARSA